MQKVLLFYAFCQLNEAEEIISRSGDPYRYKVANDHWLAKKDNQNKWFELTGSDYKPQFQDSINKLDRENPNLRSANAPYRKIAGGNVKSPKKASPSSPRITPITKSKQNVQNPEILDSFISKEFRFHLIPDGLNSNYRSAQLPIEQMRKIYSKYGIKNVIRFNGDGEKDGRHRKKYLPVSIRQERALCEELGINFEKLSATRDQKRVNELLQGGSTLVHCAHGADRTGGNVGGYFFQVKPNSSISTPEQIWKYTTQYNGWNHMCLYQPEKFLVGYIDQAKKFGIKDLRHAQQLALKK